MQLSFWTVAITTAVAVRANEKNEKMFDSYFHQVSMAHNDPLNSCVRHIETILFLSWSQPELIYFNEQGVDSSTTEDMSSSGDFPNGFVYVNYYAQASCSGEIIATSGMLILILSSTLFCVATSTDHSLKI